MPSKSNLRRGLLADCRGSCLRKTGVLQENQTTNMTFSYHRARPQSSNVNTNDAKTNNRRHTTILSGEHKENTQIYQAMPLSLLQLLPMGAPEAISSQFFDDGRRYITSQAAQVHGMSFYVDISVGLGDHVCLASAELNR